MTAPTPAGQARADRGEDGRWCATCRGFGDHYADQHDAATADLTERVAFAMHLRMGGTAEQWQSTDPNAAMDREGYHHLAAAAVEALRRALGGAS